MYNHRSHLIKKCMSYARQHCSQSTFPLDIRNCMEVILSVCVLICPTPHVDFFNLGYLKVVCVNLRARSGGMRLEKQELERGTGRVVWRGEKEGRPIIQVRDSFSQLHSMKKRMTDVFC